MWHEQCHFKRINVGILQSIVRGGWIKLLTQDILHILHHNMHNDLLCTAADARKIIQYNVKSTSFIFSTLLHLSKC